MTRRYNVAYFPPPDQEFAQGCIACARERFAGLSDGYLLGQEGALVHVTLCQFRAPEERVDWLWEEVQHIVPATIDLQTGGAYSKPGAGPDAGYSWVGLVVEPAPRLVEIQEELVRFLKGQNLETLTGVRENYFPHFTLARLGKEVPMLSAAAAEAAVDGSLKGRTLPCAAVLGYASETGAFTLR